MFPIWILDRIFIPLVIFKVLRHIYGYFTNEYRSQMYELNERLLLMKSWTHSLLDNNVWNNTANILVTQSQIIGENEVFWQPPK